MRKSDSRQIIVATESPTTPLSPEAEVEARYDGRIPRGALAAARRTATAGDVTKVTRLPPAAKKAWRSGGCVGRMAERIAACVSARGVATREDLRRAGFTAEEIERHGDDAVALAAARLLPEKGGAALDGGC
ncbi:MAG TPA: hypothetical protein VED40_19710 [Azospirillaceae bacterium]|nr:hypothetical protein [Azospirillaceae bacterium]